MTIYFVGGAVFLIIVVYLYAKKQGFKDAAFGYLESSLRTANKVDENDKKKDKEIGDKVSRFSGNNAVNFWMRKSDAEKSTDISDPKET